MVIGSGSCHICPYFIVSWEVGKRSILNTETRKVSGESIRIFDERDLCENASQREGTIIGCHLPVHIVGDIYVLSSEDYFCQIGWVSNIECQRVSRGKYSSCLDSIQESWKNRFIRRYKCTCNIGRIRTISTDCVCLIYYGREGYGIIGILEGSSDLVGLLVLSDTIEIRQSCFGIKRYLFYANFSGEENIEEILCSDIGPSIHNPRRSRAGRIQESMVFFVYLELRFDEGDITESLEIIGILDIAYIARESHGRKNRNDGDDNDEFYQCKSRGFSWSGVHGDEEKIIDMSHDNPLF